MTQRPPSRFPLPLSRLQPSARPSPRELLRPQEPLAHAQRTARHAGAASGVGLDSEAVRLNMVARLRAGGISHEAVLGAFAAVPRHRFLDSALVIQAYEDTSLPIGHGQTISKPSVVARMLALLLEGERARAAGHLGRVLEIGTGCGYQAALLRHLGRSVVSIERIAALAQHARERLAEAGADLRVLHRDGREGYPPFAPYDTIVSAAGGDAVPPAWLEQLAVGGRLVAPVFDVVRRTQVLLVVDRGAQGLVERRHDAVHFVPLESGKV